MPLIEDVIQSEEPKRSLTTAVKDTAVKFAAGVPEGIGHFAGLGVLVPKIDSAAMSVAKGLYSISDWVKEKGGLSQYQKYKDAELAETIDLGGNSLTDEVSSVLSYLGENPSQIPAQAAQALGSMLGLAGVARKLATKGLSNLGAASVATGLQTTGSEAYEIAEKNPDDYYARLYSVPAGAVSGLLTYGVGRFAQRHGLGDIEPALVGKTTDSGTKSLTKSLPVRVGGGAGAEGVEEAAQSFVERIAGNLGTGEDPFKGAAAEATLGGVIGGVLGGGVNVRRPPNTYTQNELDTAINIFYDQTQPYETRMEAARFLQQIHEDENRPKDLLSQIYTLNFQKKLDDAAKQTDSVADTQLKELEPPSFQSLLENAAKATKAAKAAKEAKEMELTPDEEGLHYAEPGQTLDMFAGYQGTDIPVVVKPEPPVQSDLVVDRLGRKKTGLGVAPISNDIDEQMPMFNKRGKPVKSVKSDLTTEAVVPPPEPKIRVRVGPITEETVTDLAKTIREGRKQSLTGPVEKRNTALESYKFELAKLMNIEQTGPENISSAAASALKRLERNIPKQIWENALDASRRIKLVPTMKSDVTPGQSDFVPISMAEAKAVFDRITSKWDKDSPAFLHDSFAVAPEYVQKAIRASGGNEKTGGVYVKGEVHVIRDAHPNAAAIEKTILHEGNHSGVVRELGQSAMAALSKLFDKLGGLEKLQEIATKYGIASKFDEYISDYKTDIRNGMSPEMAKGKLAAELAALLVENRKMKPLSAHIRRTIMTTVGALRDSFNKFNFSETSKLGESDLLWLAARGNRRLTKSGAGGRSMPALKSNVSVEAVKYAERVAGSSGKQAVTDLSQAWQTTKNYMKFLPDLIADIADDLPAAPKFLRALNTLQKERTAMAQVAEEIGARALRLSNESRDRINKFLAESTIEQKWGYDETFDDGEQVKSDPDMAKKFNALSPEEQQIVKAVFDHGRKMAKLSRAIFDKLGLEKELTPRGDLSGPYAPLMRFGNWIVVLESKEMREARLNADTKRIAELKTDPNHYVVAAFDTKGQAQAFIDSQRGRYLPTQPRPKVEMNDETFGLDEGTLLKILAVLNVDDANLPQDAVDGMRSMIRDMWIQSQSENAARMSGLKRKNIAGYEKDMLRSFIHHARAQAAFLAHLEYGGTVHDAFREMYEQVKDPTTEHRRAEKQDAFRIIARHYSELLKRKDSWTDRVQDRLTAVTTLYMLTSSVGYHVQNLTQTVHVTLPKLAADFNDYTGAWKHVLDGYKQVKKSVNMNFAWRGAVPVITPAIDLNNIKDVGLRDMLEEAQTMQLLDVGLEENLRQFEQFRTGYKWLDNASGTVSDTFHKMYQVARAVEMVNRVSAATAAYNMAKEHGHTDPKSYAIRVLQQTQGDFSAQSSPLILKKLPKITGQYRKFQLMMASLYGRAFQQAFKGATPEERALGRRFLAFKLFHTSIAAGILGWPLMNIAAMAAAFAGGDDDEPFDFERWLYSQFDDKTTADLILRGPFYALGLGGIHTKLGEQNIFSIFPYVDFSDMTSREKALSGLASMAGGPSAAIAGKLADAAEFFKKGDIYRGIESALPKGISDAMAAFRYANEGYTMRNGDVIVKPDELSQWLLADALGLPSSEIHTIKWTRSQQYEIEQFYRERSSEIRREYVKARKNKDYAKMEELRKEWKSLQEGKIRVRPFFGNSRDALKPQPLSDLLKYPKMAEKREQRNRERMADVID